MANITKFEPGAISADMFVSASENFEAAKPSVPESGGVDFLRMERDGRWIIGQDKDRVPSDSVWVIYPHSFANGFVAWNGLAFEAKAMATVGQEPINPATLPPATDEWLPNVGFSMVCIECKSSPDFVGKKAIYEQSSKGGIEAWTKLFDATMTRAKSGSEDFAPVVVLSNSFWIAKKGENKGGKVFKPVFTIEDWDEPNAVLKDFGVPLLIRSDGVDELDQKQIVPASRRKEIDAAEVEDAEIVGTTPSRRRNRNNQ